MFSDCKPPENLEKHRFFLCLLISKTSVVKHPHSALLVYPFKNYKKTRVFLQGSCVWVQLFMASWRPTPRLLLEELEWKGDTTLWFFCSLFFAHIKMTFSLRIISAYIFIYFGEFLTSVAVPMLGAGIAITQPCLTYYFTMSFTLPSEKYTKK